MANSTKEAPSHENDHHTATIEANHDVDIDSELEDDDEAAEASDQLLRIFSNIEVVREKVWLEERAELLSGGGNKKLVQRIEVARADAHAKKRNDQEAHALQTILAETSSESDSSLLDSDDISSDDSSDDTDSTDSEHEDEAEAKTRASIIRARSVRLNPASMGGCCVALLI